MISLDLNLDKCLAIYGHSNLYYKYYGGNEETVWESISMILGNIL